ncbi:MAG: hypothetical protein ACRDSI_02610 [Pseudonocardiaceae bacterium]
MSMNAKSRWCAAVLAVLAAVSLALAGCNDSSTPQAPGTTQQPGGGY